MVNYSKDKGKIVIGEAYSYTIGIRLFPSTERSDGIHHFAFTNQSLSFPKFPQFSQFP
jgi:hypothetical protein